MKRRRIMSQLLTWIIGMALICGMSLSNAVIVYADGTPSSNVGGQIHESNGDYEHDEVNHWYGCTYPGCTEHKYDVTAHAFDAWEPHPENSALEIRQCICSYHETRQAPDPTPVMPENGTPSSNVGGQIHESNGDYEHDEVNHWYGCTYPGCTEHKYDVTAHAFDAWEPHPENSALEIRQCICSYHETRQAPDPTPVMPENGTPSSVKGGKTNPHESNGDYEYDEASHWYGCSSPGCTEHKYAVTAHAFDAWELHPENSELEIRSCICGYKETKQAPGSTHSHAYGSWQSDDTHHWKTCTVAGCTDTVKEAHDFGFGWGSPFVSGYQRPDGVVVDIYTEGCSECNYSLRREVPVGGTQGGQQEGEVSDASVEETQATAVVHAQQISDTEAFKRDVMAQIKFIADVPEIGTRYGWAKPIELGANTAFDADMLNAMRDEEGKSRAEFVFLVTIDGVRYRVTIPKGANLSELPGDRVWSMEKAKDNDVEGILYVAKVAGGTVVPVDNSAPIAGGLTLTGGGSGSGAGAKLSPGLQIRQIDVSSSKANYEVKQQELTASVRNANAGQVMAVNLGTTTTLSAKFFKAATDENGLTKTNLVFTYALPGVSGGTTRQTVIPAGTDISVLTEAGRAEGILYLEHVSGCPGEVIHYDEEAADSVSGEKAPTGNDMFGALTLGHF